MLSQQAERILNRLAELGIVAPDAEITMIPGGTINTVARARAVRGGTVYVRIGPDPDALADAPAWMRADALAAEALVLPRVRAVIPCLPVPVAAGFRDSAAPWLVQEAVAGEPLEAVLPALHLRDRAEIWRALGEITRRLHTVTGPWFGTPTGSSRFGSWPEMVHADAAGLLVDAKRFGLDPAPYERLVREIQHHRDTLAAVRPPAVVHSDLDPRHVFATRREVGWAISGVIDWEYARYVDPHSESLLVAMVARPEDDPERQAFLAGYGLDAATLDDPGFRARQAIYRGIIAGWTETDAARLGRSR